MTTDLFSKDEIRAKYHSLTEEQKAEFLSGLPKKAFEAFVYSDLCLMPYQIIPSGSWRYCIFLAGRGSGKTYTGAQWIKDKVVAGAKNIAIVGASYPDLQKNMVPTLLARFPKDIRPTYTSGSNIIRCQNGCIIHCLTLDNESSRGGNYEYVWIDEIVKACDSNPKTIQERFDVLDFSVRIGKAQIYVSTTPKAFPIITNWVKRYQDNDPSIVIKTATTYDNPYLSTSAVDALKKQHGKGRLGQQELLAILLTDHPGALWSYDLIERTRKVSIEEVANPPNPNNIKVYENPMDFFIKFAIGVDPATTSHAESDKWGIIVAGLGRDNHIYIVEDKSEIMSPNDAGNLIAQLHRKYRNAQVIAEANQGGDMITYILRTKIQNLIPKLIHANKSKMTRAHPISVLWEDNRAHMVGVFDDLERELCEFTGDPTHKSPNSLDAMVYVCQWLLLEYNVRLPTETWMPNFR
jgi:phage terminase large subunit-like protein